MLYGSARRRQCGQVLLGEQLFEAAAEALGAPSPGGEPQSARVHENEQEHVQEEQDAHDDAGRCPEPRLLAWLGDRKDAEQGHGSVLAHEHAPLVAREGALVDRVDDRVGQQRVA